MLWGFVDSRQALAGIKGPSHVALAACIGNNSGGKQNMQFNVIVFRVFCALHPSTLWSRSAKYSSIFSRTHPFYPCVGGLPKQYGWVPFQVPKFPPLQL